MIIPLKIIFPDRTRPRGLGDVVHQLAQPIAKLSDQHLKTKLRHCEGCARRREKLNQLIQFT